MLKYDDIVENLKKKTVHKVFGAMMSQFLLSGANFIISLSVAKYASKTEYGKFVILFSILLAIGHYHAALFNLPMMVIYPRKKVSEKLELLAGLFHGQWLLFLIISILAIILSYFYSLCFSSEMFLENTMIMILFVWTYLYREFIRTIHYGKLTVSVLILMDLTYLTNIILFLFLLIYNFKLLNCDIVILLMSFSYLMASVFGYFCIKDRLYFDIKIIIDSFKETWNCSFWALQGVTYSIIQSRGYLYIVTLNLGFEELANLSAARLLLTPLYLFLNSTQKIFVAKGADLLEKNGLTFMRKFVLGMVALLLTTCLFYSLLLWFGFDLIISIIGSKYAGIESLVLFWFCYFLFFSLRFSIQNILIIFKEFKKTANSDLVGAVITVCLCFILTKTSGSAGGILSLIIGESVVLLLLLRRVRVLLLPAATKT